MTIQRLLTQAGDIRVNGYTIHLENGDVYYKDGLLLGKEIEEIDGLLEELEGRCQFAELEMRYFRGRTTYYFCLGQAIYSILIDFEIEGHPIYIDPASFYGKCIKLGKMSYEVSKKLTVDQWEDLIDFEDKWQCRALREYIEEMEGEISQKDWKRLLRNINKWLKRKDFSVFTKDERLEIVNKLAC